MDGMAQGVPRVLHDLVMAGISRAGSQHHVRNHLELERQKGDSWEIHTTCQHCHHQFPTSSSCSVTLKVSMLPGSPPRSVISVNCPSKQIRFSYSTWRTVTHLAKCPMCAVFAMTDCQPLAMQRRILEHERFALSFLPRNFLTGDILCKSCLEALEQEGLSMFQVLATVFEPEGKDREPNQESSIIQKARAIARVASWNRGHDPKFSSAGTERDSIHHCEEHWLPSTTQKNCKENCLWTQNTPDVLQQGIWLKNYVLPSSRNSK